MGWTVCSDSSPSCSSMNFNEPLPILASLLEPFFEYLPKYLPNHTHAIHLSNNYHKPQTRRPDHDSRTISGLQCRPSLFCLWWQTYLWLTAIRRLDSPASLSNLSGTWNRIDHNWKYQTWCINSCRNHINGNFAVRTFRTLCLCRQSTWLSTILEQFTPFIYRRPRYKFIETSLADESPVVRDYPSWAQY